MTELERWRAYLADWEVGGALPLKLRAVSQNEQVMVCVELRITEANAIPYDPSSATSTGFTAVPGDSINFTQVVPFRLQPDTYEAHCWVRELLRSVYLHELDEFIKVRGARVFDPHSPIRVAQYVNLSIN